MIIGSNHETKYSKQESILLIREKYPYLQSISKMMSWSCGAICGLAGSNVSLASLLIQWLTHHVVAVNGESSLKTCFRPFFNGAPPGAIVIR